MGRCWTDFDTVPIKTIFTLRLQDMRIEIIEKAYLMTKKWLQERWPEVEAAAVVAAEAAWQHLSAWI